METVAELPLVGGHVALDFVNTAEQRGHPDAGDALRTAADLHAWGVRYGLITRWSARTGYTAATEFVRAIEARELLYALLLARAEHRPLGASQLAELTGLATDAYGAGSLQRGPDDSVSWQWSRSDLATIRHIGVISAVELLRAPAVSRLKQCPGEHCGWFFLDTTKRGNRRWCSMGECGQDAKDAQRRAKRRRQSMGE